MNSENKWKNIKKAMTEERGQDGGVERPWAQLFSWVHQNHNYLQNNCRWKRLEPKDTKEP